MQSTAQTTGEAASSAPKPWFYSRWGLHAKARTIRLLGAPAFLLHNAAHPAAPGPDQTIYIDSTLGKSRVKNAIGISIYRPKSTGAVAGAKPGAMINYHGGGFTIGSATDDSRWCRTVCNELGMVVFSVEYRMAPEQPFPVPGEDCADAVLAVVGRAEEFGIDPGNITLSGFSAGGNLALTSWVLCHQPTSAHWSYPSLQIPSGAIRGLVLFYPVVDFSKPRAEKLAEIPSDYPVLPAFLTQLFDQSYIYPMQTREQRKDLRLSPGLMDEALLDKCPPVHLVVCQHDMLAEESRVFARRLKEKGEGKVVLREVEGEAHGWDKPPVITPKPSVMVEYGEAVRSMRGWSA
ncbi:Alpha/Beta hydrolase protein [Dioszegia hungarica]|uniref:Alpha/Beta hydrolase protein n=1 Tax=Dioszegia hungarica TaxID=4972 RepID=A0AA38LRC7_9TREE|nr:Alpha/Beta hydrolase protein [Dioszegia hungarica]KAI9634347.1 Alpha/Beta hydrolase protein [Dioszegia hungarica]